MKSATTASTATPSPAIRMPVWPVALKSAAMPRSLQPAGQGDRRDHLADRAIRADGEQAVARPRIALADRQARRADRGHRRACRFRCSRERGEARLVAQPLVEARSHVQPGVQRRRRIVDEIGAELAAGPGDAEHQSPRARRDRLLHAQPRQTERQRTIVVPELADAILAAGTSATPARRLDARADRRCGPDREG